jgi:predicted transcriptional regulator
MANDLGISLRDFVKGRTQPELGLMLGVSQSAVSQMLSSGRDIRIQVDEQGRYSAFEIRRVGNRKKSTAA